MEENEKKLDIILEQWKTCVEMTDSISARRGAINSVFASLNIAILAAAAYIWNLKTILLFSAGLAICILWIHTIYNYKLLNKEKFIIIDNLEESLPVRPFKDEWRALTKNEKYKDLTKLEKGLPITFILLYVISIILIVCNLLVN